MSRKYITLAQTEAGEIGHNGWMLTLNWIAQKQRELGNYNVSIDNRTEFVTSYENVDGIQKAVRSLAPWGGNAIATLDKNGVAAFEERARAHKAACDAAEWTWGGR